jgi:hypothetical protein
MIPHLGESANTADFLYNAYYENSWSQHSSKLSAKKKWWTSLRNLTKIHSVTGSVSPFHGPLAD